MSTHDDGGTTDMTTTASQLRELREETEALARTLPGTMRRLTVRAGDCRVEVEWAAPAAAPAPALASAPAAAGTAHTDATSTADGPPGHPVTAPLVGTFYQAPEPGADPFVQVGGPVEAGQDVCIVEAMKIMNRVQSDVTGIVREVLVADGEIVEYGQPLMVVDVGHADLDGAG